MKQEIGACIVELRGRYAAALTENGQFVRIRNKNYKVGQTVCLRQAESNPARRLQLRTLASMAAGLLFLILGGFKGYQTPVGVVSLDVNPSIEYTINCFDRVLAIEGVNDDGTLILERIDEALLVNLPVDEAVQQTIAVLRENGYLQQETENDVLLSSSSYSERHSERLAQELKDRVALKQGLTIVSISVTGEEVEKAHALGTSAGKLFIIEQLGRSTGEGESFEVTDWLGKPVREIMERTQEQLGANSQKGGQKTDTQKQGQSMPSGESVVTPSPYQFQPASPVDGGQSGQDGSAQQDGGTQEGNPPQGNSGGNPPQVPSNPEHG